jgi:hypothetical protein
MAATKRPKKPNEKDPSPEPGTPPIDFEDVMKRLLKASPKHRLSAKRRGKKNRASESISRDGTALRHSRFDSCSPESKRKPPLPKFSDI